MAHLQNWFGLLRPDIATILPWSESLNKALDSHRSTRLNSTQLNST